LKNQIASDLPNWTFLLFLQNFQTKTLMKMVI
jgi:hypothetical protein